MKNKAYNLTTYSFQKNETILFDANVWLYLLPATSRTQPRYVTGYAGGLKSMKMAGAHLVVDAIVLSEYLNSYCRIVWRASFEKMYPQFKKFRDSTKFARIGKKAAKDAHRILRLSDRCDHLFTQTDVTRVLNDFEAGINDFNDGLLADTCRNQGWKLVTNDSDFTSGGIVILTTNPRLLRACP